MTTSWTMPVKVHSKIVNVCDNYIATQLTLIITSVFLSELCVNMFHIDIRRYMCMYIGRDIGLQRGQPLLIFGCRRALENTY